MVSTTVVYLGAPLTHAFAEPPSFEGIRLVAADFGTPSTDRRCHSVRCAVHIPPPIKQSDDVTYQRQ